MRYIITIFGIILSCLGLVLSWIGAGFAGYSGSNHSMWIQLTYLRPEFLIFQIPFYGGAILLLIGIYLGLNHDSDR